ncbi:MAG: hypothetical protein IKD55_11145 [Sediminibacterium sp.]|nr:hypothetical protein [Sediminibacterium sp.]MBX9779685.1 hypothetical protein [Chitinophagaceae bacterium]
MKKIAAILLIAGFLVQSTSQLFILAIFKINQEYIAENLCINRFDAIPICKGSCFLEDQLVQNEKRQQKSPDLSIKNLTLFCQAFPIACFKVGTNLSQTITYPTLNTSFISSNFLQSVFRPPSFLA